tara:strand:+ start:341 stop:718 length:378 start_codon:yes stop_codon:yes gene_type:complete
MIGMLLGPIAEVAKTWIGGKVEVAKAKSQANLETTKARAEVMKKVAAGELDWNQTMAEASNKSWKDEWLTILVSIPLILAFTGHEAIVTRGFAALETMPDFYKTAVGVVFAASFGIQSIKNMMKK